MKKPSWSFFWWSGLSIIYLFISFLQPIDKKQLSKYHLSVLAIRWIDVSIILPVLVILYFAYVGFINLRRYYLSIKNSSDGLAFKYIAIGIGVFAYGSLAQSIIGSGLKWIAYDNHSFTADETRITTYMAMVIPLFAFWFIAVGVGNLVKVGKIKFGDLPVKTGMAVIAILGASYAFVVFHQDKGISSLTGTKIFFMPEWLILLTVVVPYVFAWSLGLLSFIQMITYRHKVKGLVYRHNLNLLAYGLGTILICYVVIEYLTSLVNHYIFHQINLLLAIVYVLLIVIGIGYLMIAIGARRLKKIEEV